MRRPPNVLLSLNAQWNTFTSSIASRVYLQIKKVNKKHLGYLQSKLSRSDLESYLDKGQTFKVEVFENCSQDQRIGKNTLGKSVRLAVEERFNFKKLPKPFVELKDPDIIFVGFYDGNEFTLSVDLCGRSLHKRGFRKFNHFAPIKETLAATLVKHVEDTEALYDPFCGGGTIIIEAAYAALNKAVSIHRKRHSFALEKMPLFKYDTWRKTQDALRQQRLAQPKFKLFASDISDGDTEGARENALSAKVEKHIEIFQKDFFDSEKPTESGTILTNLPYDERVKHNQEFYKKIGDHLKNNYKGWKAYLLMHGSAGSIGLKPSSKINFKNGSIPVKLCEYEIF